MAGYGAPHVSQEAIERRQREEHNEDMREHASQSRAYQRLNEEVPLTTEFGNIDIDTMKSMLAHVNPSGVEQVGHHWLTVHDQLMGPGGGGSGDCAHGMLKKAVDDVMQHWEGESANQFRSEANKILRQISNTASHAKTVSSAVVQTGGDIRTQKQALDAIEKPSWFSSAWDSLTDSGRTDEFTQEEIRKGTLPKDVLADIEEENLSAGKEAQLNAAAVMENLARSYVRTGQHLKSAAPVGDPGNDVPPSNPTVPMPTPIPPFSGSSSTPSTRTPSLKPGNWSTGKKPPEPKLLRDMGIHGGEQLPLTKTKIDGLQQGITSHSVPETPPNGGAPIPRGGTPGPSHMGTPNIPGVPQGGLSNGGPGTRTPGRGPGGRPGIRSGIGSGSTEHGSSGGRMGGMRGGMHGMGGGGGAGGKGSAAGGRGPLARAKGGVAGAPKGITGGKGPATPGGTGLGRGRGGGASEAGGRGTRGMFAGGMRGSNQRPGDEENEEGSRPDYLVEDEETWTPEDGRSVPRNIE